DFGADTGGNPEEAMPVFVVGRVITDDSSSLPTGVLIERTCGSAVQTLGYADAKGAFGVFVTGDMRIIQDAAANPDSGLFPQGKQTDLGAFRELLLQSCELRAQYPGYVSSTLHFTGPHPLANANIGTIVVHRAGAKPEATVSATSLAAPK